MEGVPVAAVQVAWRDERQRQIPRAYRFILRHYGPDALLFVLEARAAQEPQEQTLETMAPCSVKSSGTNKRDPARPRAQR